MNRRTRRGFTLVELLVVITIIGMLIALLMPAVQAARERARYTKCMSHQKQLALAALAYESTYGKFPGYVNNIGGKKAGWIVPLFPHLELTPLYNKWQSGAKLEFLKVYLEFMICPSNPPEQTTVGQTWSAYLANRLVFGHFPPESDPPTEPEDLRPLAVEWISSKDGASTTLMISETLDEHNWEAWSYKATCFGADGQIKDYLSSNHGGGVIAAFCGGNVQFLRDDISHEVYKLLVAANDCDDPTKPILDPADYL